MTHLQHDESTRQLRRGFKAAAAAVALTAVLLAVQDWLPGARAPFATTPVAASAAKTALPLAAGPVPVAAR